MSSYQIRADYASHGPDAQRLQDAIDHYNLSTTGVREFWPITLSLRNAEGTLCGGLVGMVWAGWLHVQVLWLEPELRGSGHGSQLLQAAEDYAYRRGARHAHLSSFTFQAPGFYQKHGYEVFGELSDFPSGQSQVFLQKALRAEP